MRNRADKGDTANALKADPSPFRAPGSFDALAVPYGMEEIGGPGGT